MWLSSLINCGLETIVYKYILWRWARIINLSAEILEVAEFLGGNHTGIHKINVYDGFWDHISEDLEKYENNFIDAKKWDRWTKRERRDEKENRQNEKIENCVSFM